MCILCYTYKVALCLKQRKSALSLLHLKALNIFSISFLLGVMESYMNTKPQILNHISKGFKGAAHQRIFLH